MYDIRLLTQETTKKSEKVAQPAVLSGSYSLYAWLRLQDFAGGIQCRDAASIKPNMIVPRLVHTWPSVCALITISTPFLDFSCKEAPGSVCSYTGASEGLCHFSKEELSSSHVKIPEPICHACDISRFLDPSRLMCPGGVDAAKPPKTYTSRIPASHRGCILCCTSSIYGNLSKSPKIQLSRLGG